MKKIFILLVISTILLISCDKQKKEKGTDLLKFQGSWFLRVNEIDWSDTINPGKMVPVEGNEIYADFTPKVINLIREGKIQAYSEDNNKISYKRVMYNLVSEGLKKQIDSNKVSESDILNIKLVGIELNDSINLDIERNSKTYKMQSVTLFIPAEFSFNAINQPICKILYEDLKNNGFEKELAAFEARNFARKEKIYLPDGTVKMEYTFYLTDAAGVEYYFRIPLEKVLEDDHLIQNSILHYFKDDLVDN
ncbi:MAG: hypothetical protein SFY32_03780 [Bacteroidota bacterium]|nr:hypothetical protein [Bacteroidota bacterium]